MSSKAKKQTLSLAHLAQDISAGIGLPVSTTRDVLALLTDRITENLLLGHSVQIRGVGTIRPVQASARIARNPATGAPIALPERTVLRFKPSAELARQLRDSTPE